jgi:hypothetical protein
MFSGCNVQHVTFDGGDKERLELRLGATASQPFLRKIQCGFAVLIFALGFLGRGFLFRELAGFTNSLPVLRISRVVTFKADAGV